MPAPVRPRSGVALGRIVLVMLAAVALVTCTEEPTSPTRPGVGTLRVGPQFDAFARLVPLTLDNVRVIVVRPPSDTILRAARTFSPSNQQLTLSLPVLLLSSSEALEVTLELYAGTTLLFTGTSTVQVAAGGTTPPATVPVGYQGPGSTLTAITLAPRDTTVSLGATFPFGATAVDAQQNNVPQFYVSWSADAGSIDAAGVFTAPTVRDTLYVRAATPNGVMDSTRVFVTAPPSTLTRTGGDAQSGIIGTRLPQLLAVRVNGSDGQPVAGASVAFTVTTGGGSVDSAQATSDAQGVARTGATLGLTVGQQSFTATVSGIPSAVFTATATGVAPVVTTLSAGGSTSCEIRGGQTLCWGENNFGQLGDGTTTTRAVPGPISGAFSFTSVTVGTTHSCALTASGQAFCWGDNSLGALGDGTTTDRLTPTAVSGGQSFVQLAAGTGVTCGLTSTGQAFCWGSNNLGELGDGTTTDRTIPTAVTGGFVFTAIDTNGDHSCGLTAQGDVRCWGRNQDGELGDGTQTDRPTPTLVTGGHSFTAINAGATSTCGLDGSGAGFCWGRNFGLQLTSPQPVAGGFTFTALSETGHNHVCALTAGGWRCGGDNAFGQLGDGTTIDRSAPVLPSGGFTFQTMAVGTGHTCGRTSTATLCWGLNAAGQLGDGTTTDRLTPTLTVGPASTAAVSAGNGQTATAGTAVAVAPAIVVRDALNNPVRGLDVVFAVTGGGGSLTGATTQTDAAGVATVGSWTLGATPGANALSATVLVGGVGGNPVNFTATGTGAGPVVYTWTGATSGDWSVAGNWSPAGVPGPADDAVITAAGQAPVLSTSVSATNVTVPSGVTLSLGGNTLTASGNVSAGTTISNGTLIMTGNGTTLQGTVPDLVISLANLTDVVTVTGALTATSLTVDGGRLVVGGQSVNVSGNLTTDLAGVLVMTNPADLVTVNGSATFGGENETGLLTAGTIRLRGSLTQNVGASPSSFVASGTHKVILDGTTGQVIRFNAPTQSRLQDLELANPSGGTSFFTDATISGQLSEQMGVTGSITAGGAFTATVGGLDLDGMVLGAIVLDVVGTSAITRFDNVQFVNYPETAIALRIARPNGNFTFSNLIFGNTAAGGPPTTGLYLQADDTNPTDGQALTVSLVNPFPASDGGFSQALNGAVINWPAAGSGVATWNGSASTAWGDPSNWTPAVVPGSLDSVAIPSGLTTYPTITGRVSVRTIGLDGRITINGGTLAVTEDITGTVFGRLVQTTLITDSVLVGDSVNANIAGGSASGIPGNGGVLVVGGSIGSGMGWTFLTTVLNGAGTQVWAGQGTGGQGGVLLVRKPSGSVSFTGGFRADSVDVNTAIPITVTGSLRHERGFITAGDLTVTGSHDAIGILVVSGTYAPTTTIFTLGSYAATLQIPATTYQALTIGASGGNGSAVFTGRTTVAGLLNVGGTADGTVALNGNTVIAGSFQSSGIGPFRIAMTNPLDSLIVAGSATLNASGINNPGNLTAGAALFGGNFTINTGFGGVKWQSTGTHTTVFTGANPVITLGFGSGPATNQDRFNDLTWTGAGTLTLGSVVYASGGFATTATGPVTVLGSVAGSQPFTFRDRSAAGPTTFDNVSVVVTQSGTGTPVGLDNTTFQNMSTTVTQLSLAHPGVSGGSVALTGLSFATTPTTGFYLSATDNNTGDGFPLVVDLVNPTPATDGGFKQELGGAVINWPAAAPAVTWTGAFNANWHQPLNWSSGSVPTALNDVTIPSGTPVAPVLASGPASVGALTLQPTATLDLAGFTLTVNGNLDASGSGITGTTGSRIVMAGTSVTAQGFVGVDVTIQGTTTLINSFGMSGALLVQGTLNLGGLDLQVGGDLTTDGAAALIVMQNPADFLTVNGNATFDGGNQLGQMSTGVLVLGGDLTQAATFSADAFHPSGTHTTMFTGATPTVTFATPGLVPGSSHFQFLQLASGSAVAMTLGSDVFAHDALTVSVSGPVTFTGTNRTLTAGGFASSGFPVTFDNVPLELDMSFGGPLGLSDLTFQNMNPSVTQLTVTHPGTGGPFTLANLTFINPPTGGLYLRADDLDGAANGVLTLDLTNPTPATDGGFSLAQGGAVINWPAGGGGTITWSGSVSSDWFSAGNWVGGVVPSAFDDVVIGPATNQPVLTNNAGINGLTVQAGVTLELGDFVLAVSGDVDVAGTVDDATGTGNGGITLGGNGTTYRGALLTTVILGGSATLTGPLTTGDLALFGALGIGGQSLDVQGIFSVSGAGGLLNMTNPADQVTVSGDAVFDGGNSVGWLAAGVLTIGGDFIQLATNSAQSFAADPGHLTVMSANPANITFTTPGANGSHFGDFSESGFGATFNLNSDVTILGFLSGGDGFGGTMVGSSCPTTLTLNGYSTSGPLQLDCVRLVIDDPAGNNTFLNGISFSNLPTDVTQLTIQHPGVGTGNLQFGGMTFVPLTAGDLGFYVSAVETTSGAPALVVDFLSNGANVGNGPTFTSTSGGASVLWP